MFTCMKISPSMSEFLHLTESALFSHTQSVKVFFSDAKLVKSSPSEAFLQFRYSLFFQLVRTFLSDLLSRQVHFDLPQLWLVLCSFCVRLHHFSMLVLCSVRALWPNPNLTHCSCLCYQTGEKQKQITFSLFSPYTSQDLLIFPRFLMCIQ